MKDSFSSYPGGFFLLLRRSRPGDYTKKTVSGNLPTDCFILTERKEALESFFSPFFFFELGRTRCDRQTDELFLRTPLLLGDFLMSPDLSPSHLSFRLFCISR